VFLPHHIPNVVTHTVCVSCWKEVQSQVCRSRGCDIIIPYMHHACAGFLEWRWPNITAHCCMPRTIMWQDPVLGPTTMISRRTSRGEYTKHCDKVSTLRSHTSSHKPTQMFCAAVQELHPTVKEKTYTRHKLIETGKQGMCVRETQAIIDKAPRLGTHTWPWKSTSV